MSELRALLQSQGNGKGVTSIKPFDIVVAYAPSVSDIQSHQTVWFTVNSQNVK
jgi:hypothetical protein